MFQRSAPKTLFIISLIFSALLIFQSCRKDSNLGNGDSHTNLTIQGIITDASGIPLPNVSVKAGSVTVTTDANGSFRATNASFATEETFVTATKGGYFTGSRTFIPREGSNNFLRIRLMPRIQV